MNEILDEIEKKASEIGATKEDIKAIGVYLESDKYRKKLLDFLNIAEDKGDVMTADNLMILTIKLSNEEEKDMR